jgi:hypothetical protein
MSEEQFILGIKNIQKAVIDKLMAAGIKAETDNFIWHRGKNLLPIPTIVSLEVNVQGKTVTADFDREQIEDSWSHINRKDVRLVVDFLFGHLTA